MGSREATLHSDGAPLPICLCVVTDPLVRCAMPSPWSSPKDPAYPGHIPPEFRDGSPFYPTGYFGDPIPLEYPALAVVQHEV